jgi:D-amino-acid dehydrogenase
MAKHLVVIGGGIIGLCTAYYAMERGHRVTVLERGPREAEGCSFGNMGMIVPSHVVPLAAPGMVALGLKWMWNPESPFYIKPRLDPELLDWGLKFWRASTVEHVSRSAPLLRDLHLASRSCFEDLAAKWNNDFEFVTKGLLMLCQSESMLEEEGRAALRARELGIPAEVLDARQTAALDPAVRMNVAGSVYFPKDCHLSPARFMSRLRHELEQRGAHLVYDAEISNWQIRDDKIKAVISPAGDFSGDEYALCAGSWSARLARELKLKIPLQAGKGYSITLPRPRQVPRICAIFTEARVAVTPMNGFLRFGGTMEIAGLNEEINSTRVRGIVKSALQYYPEFRAADFEGVPAWCGLRPCSPDGLPYCGRTAQCRNLLIATGHAMMGLSLGPITGKLMAEILDGRSPSINIQLLNPDRYN